MTRYSILIIEDDPAVAESLRAGLTREGFAVNSVSSGTEGMEHARKSPPHLILLDIRLPDGSGCDICRKIRQSGLHQPIIILTAQQDDLDRVLGPEMGADDYVTKPFGLRELVSRIRAQLRRACGDYAAPDSASILVADLPQLLNRFHHGRNTNAYPGSGLGLTIVRAIAVAQGGGVDVQSAGEGRGSQFSFRLPAVPSQ